MSWPLLAVLDSQARRKSCSAVGENLNLVFRRDACFTGICEGWRTIHKRVRITQYFASTSISLMGLALKSCPDLGSDQLPDRFEAAENLKRAISQL